MFSVVDDSSIDSKFEGSSTFCVQANKPSKREQANNFFMVQNLSELIISKL
jgi:hypothetical protein